ncbi:MAG: BREX-2 system adenine-specific DNA-methyltransferase PglX [Magnetococcales bacterium]|nr:BREX-2 system adenine-specific DNA-methyltransferase PglX [Magnetococcales bacterium]MBF0149121.1 BREX-2 system adenine-specific DNA-methyltransferase PglX [Magnetococcales bacterium]
MINAATLLKDLKGLLPGLEDDIRVRLEETPEEKARLEGQYQEARDGGRTGAAWEAWRDERVTQAAAAWVLAGVFVRFMEDNGLIEQPWLSGPNDEQNNRRRLAEDRRTLYFHNHPSHNDRDYLLHAFAEVAKYPAVGALFDQRFNPLWGMMPSGDGAAGLLAFWQGIDPATGALNHDFTDPDWNTRFLGDLYQDLSENIRKQYALLQTPEFVESFILDRTLTPAIEEFGFESVRLIDPTCGSGHFLLGTFHRLFALWQAKEPGTNARALAQRALDGVWGVDLNPYAVAISRFRLLVAALKGCGITRMADAPGFVIHLAAGDSLLHGPRFRKGGGMVQMTLDPEDDPLRHVYETEDKESLREILGQQYHAVVGNPPYITPKDKALNQAYRDRYPSCHRQYSLGVPFTERFFDLAIQDRNGQPAGFVGLITANSFMKREFGKKLIELFFKTVDLNTVIDTSGAYIPGHGTPTVILFGQHSRPALSVVRTVQGIRGEPSTPADAAHGQVWSSIVAMIDQPGSENEFISVVDTPRTMFETHPWSLGGGGASELKDEIEAACKSTLDDEKSVIGFVCMTRADDVYFTPQKALMRAGIEDRFIIENIEGDCVRDWNIQEPNTTLFPYDNDLQPVNDREGLFVKRFLWPHRTILWLRREPNGNHKEMGRTWYEWSRFQRERFLSPLSIAFAEIATHNHFVLDRGGKVFNRTAPVIKLPLEATEADHLALLGLLNCSTGLFWLRQVCFPKGGFAAGRWEERYVFNAGNLTQFPIPTDKPFFLSSHLDQLAQERQSHLPAQLTGQLPMPREALEGHRARAESLLCRMIALQEELDWQCYHLYGILDEELTHPGEPPEVRLGERPFEILMGRQMAEGELESTWFERHGATPITEIPAHWPADYRATVERRLAAIEKYHNIRLIEQPEYKRRWNLKSWESQEQHALRGWLLDRMEVMTVWRSDAPELATCARLADQLHHDTDFIQVAALFRGRSDFDLTQLVTELVLDEAVPFLPILRYKDSGLRKRTAWERTWALQRKEDAGETVGDIPVPPKYAAADFLQTSFWRLRGKLDVPKERFVLYPHCEKASDPTPVIAWAGWNPLQQAQALAGYFISMKDNEGWSAERLTPLLAGLLELLPWLKQWHNEPDPAFGTGMGDYFAGFIDEQLRALELTGTKVQSWRPPQAARHRGRRKKTE